MERIVSGVGVLDKSILLLEAVAEEGSASLGQLVERTGLPKPTAHRLATALVRHGLLRRGDDGVLELGARLIGLGHRASAGWPIAGHARPVLRGLRDETGESAQLYVRDGDQRICLVSLDSTHELRTIVAEGSRLPLDVGSAGRLLAGGHPGSPGWAASVEERAPGVASVSAPVVVGGSVVAAIGVSGPVGRLGREPGDRLGPVVARAAERIAERAST